ncbi:MAG: CdaR family protein [Oscillospiraceae bacterium]
MKQSKGQKVLHIAISILVAFAIWLYTADTTEVTKAANNVPVEFIGADTTLAARGLMLIQEEQEPPTISLKLRGKRTTISRLDTKKLRIQVDLSNVTAVGTQNLSYKIIYPSNISSGSISVESASAYNVAVNVGELYRKSVDILCDVTGTLPEGYLAGALELTPATLELWGQQADVMQISYAKVTLDIADATSTVVRLLDYELFNYNDQPIETPNIHSAGDTVQVTLPVEVVKDLPLKLIFEEAPGASTNNINYAIQPATIKVSGDPATLEAVDSIVLDTIHLEDLTDSASYEYAIALPEGCDNLSGVETARVSISFRDMASRKFTVTDFTYENAPVGREITVLTPELEVVLRGTSVDLDALTPTDVQVAADLSGVTTASGSYTVPAIVTARSNGNVGVVGTYHLKVTIEEPAPPMTEPEPGE